MDAIVTAVTTIFTGAIGWVSTAATTVTETPLLLTFAVIPLVGLGVGLLRRLLNVN